MLAFDERLPEFEKANTQVLGISIDTVPALGAFAKELGLKFPLLSDFPNFQTTKAYGTFVEGRSVSRRVTYVVDKEGIIRAEIVSDMDMTKHSEDALKAVRELEGITA